MKGHIFFQPRMLTTESGRYGMLLLASIFFAFFAGTTVQAGLPTGVTGKIPGNVPHPHLYRDIRSKKPADLAIISVNHPSSVRLGEVIQVTITVQNKGASASGPFHINLNRCPDRVNSPCRGNHPADLSTTSFQPCNSLEQGERCTKSFDFSYTHFPGRNHETWFTVKAPPVHLEQNTNNNQLHHPKAVRLYPDIMGH
ncbi:MAG TPA: hypothetical protein ENK84_07045 [Desulfobulbus sp.]|nr:hypothetical protein [Desulfobulbus sp.]